MKANLLVIFGLIAVLLFSGCITNPVIKSDEENTNNAINEIPKEICGDGICNAEETCGFCSRDCGDCDIVCNNARISLGRVTYFEELEGEEDTILLKIRHRVGNFPLTLIPSIVYKDSSQSVGEQFYLPAYVDDMYEYTSARIHVYGKENLKEIHVQSVECENVRDFYGRVNIVNLD